MARRTARTPRRVDLLKAAINERGWESFHRLVLESETTPSLIVDAARKAKRDLLSITLAWQTWAVLACPSAEVDAVMGKLSEQLPLFAFPSEMGAA